MGNPRCNWVRDRLPLLAGGELAGLERRRAERHLIGCPQCRSHRLALGAALDALHAAAAGPPPAEVGASLWPAVARQIRESRRPASSSGFPWPALFSFGLQPRFWPSFALTMGLLAALGATAAARKQVAGARALALAARRPLPPPTLRPSPLALAPSQVAQTAPAPKSAPPARYDYDLERGTPMNPDVVEGKTATKAATY